MNILKKITIFFSVLPCLNFCVYGQTKHGLVIGLGQYQDKTWGTIHGDNDVPLVKDMLAACGYKDIVTLVNKDATKDGVISSFENLSRKCKNGDIVYIHFSGHGQQITDVNGDEDDGFDEAWIPYDAMYAYSSQDDPYNTFESYTRIKITKDAPIPLLAKGKGTVFEKVYFTVSKLPYFEEMEIPNNEDYGFPEYLGKGTAVVYGNADPKEDILRFLTLVPQKFLAFEDVDEKGRITRYYVDYGKKQVLYFFGGIGGNDLVVALFKDGDKKKIHSFVNNLNTRKK